MLWVGLISAAVATSVAGYLLIKGKQPQLVLLAAGLVLLSSAWLLGQPILLKSPTGWPGFDMFEKITLSLRSKLGGIGTMIMVIAGFVAYMDYMGATRSLVEAAVKPIAFLEKTPNIAAVLVLPLGQVLSLCVPSAAGLGLLMIASVHPILMRIGVSKLASVSIIVLCTCFDMGPASANTARASELLGMDNVTYFLGHQAPFAGIFTLVIMAVVYLQLRRFETQGNAKEDATITEAQAAVPAYYALLPILPLILLMVFSAFVQTGANPIVLDTSTAMLVSLAVAMLTHALSGAGFREVEAGLKACWNGMGQAFSRVVTLIVAADLFAQGLIQLGLIEGLVNFSNGLGWGSVGVLLVFVMLIFFASILMGSGNATFFAFAPLVSRVAETMGISGIRLLLPMQLASSMGRAASPISGVVIATAGIANVNPLHVAKRNLLPLAVALTMMLITESWILI